MARTNPSAKAAAPAAPVAEPEAPAAPAESLVLPEDESDAPTPLAVKEEAPPPAPARSGRVRYRTLAQCSGLLAEGKLVPPGEILELDDSTAVHYLKQNAIERVL